MLMCHAAKDRPRLHILAGLFLAWAYFAKGSQLMLLGLYPLMAFITAGPGVFRRRWLWIGMATALLAMSLLISAPFWASYYNEPTPRPLFP